MTLLFILEITAFHCQSSQAKKLQILGNVSEGIKDLGIENRFTDCGGRGGIDADTKMSYRSTVTATNYF